MSFAKKMATFSGKHLASSRKSANPTASCLLAVALAACLIVQSARSNGELLEQALKATSLDPVTLNLRANEPESVREGSASWHYAAVLDCGSSATRLRLFGWDPALEFPDFLERIQPMQAELKHQVPVSTLKGDMDETRDYFKRFSDHIEANLPAHRLEHVAVYVLATDGLQFVDKERRKIVFAQAEQTFRDQNFTIIRVRPISRAQEAIFQWLAVNSKLGVFSRKSYPAQSSGIIELGGDSVQLTFELDEQGEQQIEKILAQSQAQIELRQLKFEPHIGKTKYMVDGQGNRQETSDSYRLFSATFAGLGDIVARENYIKFILAEYMQSASDQADPVGSTTIVQDPCMPRGAQASFYIQDEMLRPERILKQSIMHRFDYHLIEVDANLDIATVRTDGHFKVVVQGAGAMDKCEQTLAAMLGVMKDSLIGWLPGHACASGLLASKFLPSPMPFIGLGSFGLLTRGKSQPMLHSDGSLDSSGLEKEVSVACEKPLSTLSRALPNLSATAISQECFKLMWVRALTGKRGLFIGANKLHPKVGPTWHLGAVIDRALDQEMAIYSRPAASQLAAIVSSGRSFDKTTMRLEQSNAWLAKYIAIHPEEKMTLDPSDHVRVKQELREILELEAFAVPKPSEFYIRRRLDALARLGQISDAKCSLAWAQQLADAKQFNKDAGPRLRNYVIKVYEEQMNVCKNLMARLVGQARTSIAVEMLTNEILKDAANKNDKARLGTLSSGRILSGLQRYLLKKQSASDTGASVAQNLGKLGKDLETILLECRSVKEQLGPVVEIAELIKLASLNGSPLVGYERQLAKAHICRHLGHFNLVALIEILHSSA